jgi:hypothetical protein
MLQHDQQLEALQRMFSAYIDMRRRLNRIDSDRDIERSHRKLDRDLERFRSKITHLWLPLARARRAAPLCETSIFRKDTSTPAVPCQTFRRHPA